MNMTSWVDAQLSSELAALRHGGEGQALEFKREIPAQARELAREVAAFASSNDGLILLGVGDDGSLIGLPAQTPQERDVLIQRLAGICKIIQPPVLTSFVWAMEGESVVLGIRVSKGREPLYYVEHRPYIRYASLSRPAEPAEVIEAVRSHLEKGEVKRDSAEATLLSALARTLVIVLRWGDTDSEIKSLNPWVGEWMSDAEQGAEALRDLASEALAIERGYAERLKELADRLDAVAEFRHTFGGGTDFGAVTEQARDLAQTLMDELVSPTPMDKAAAAEVRDAIAKMARKLTDVWRHASNKLFDGAVEEGQEESGRLGRKLMELSYYPLELGVPDALPRLRAVGQRLIELEALTIYMDGGTSQRRAVERGTACATELTEIASTLGA